MTNSDPPAVSRRGFLATSAAAVAAGAVPAGTGSATTTA
ncbi:twin-arginine translocation signal domain-containing protein, partial [Nonomuraea sp. NPDC049784]